MSPVTFEEELKKNPELRVSDIENLHRWCAKQPHLPKISDKDLAIFLHSNYYLMEPTKTTIDTYYTIKTHVPEFFSDRDILGSEALRHISSVVLCLPLKRHTPEGYGMFLSKLIDIDSSKYVFNDHSKLAFMTLDLWINEEGTKNGLMLLFDVGTVSLGHSARLSPTSLKKFFRYLQDGLPVRLKGMHFINMTPAFDIILSMMKPFLKKELVESMHLHSSMESLNKFYPIENLPNEMGGKAGTIASIWNEQLKNLENHRDWFLEEETHARVNESKRPGKAKTASDLFGIEGSFRKLDID